MIIANLDRESTVAAFQAADLFIFPSNIECSPLVLFEAAAAGTPFLASDCGNAKEIAGWLKSGEILPTSVDDKGYSHADIQQSAAMLEEITSDKSQLEKMGKKGLEVWREKFTWGKNSRRV